MSDHSTDDNLTELLNRWGSRSAAGSESGTGVGDPEIEVLYGRCRALVQRVKRRASSLPGLDTTDLLHRAWERTLLLKGDDSPERRWNSREHFFATLVRSTIESVIDEARHRNARKRGGGSTPISTSQLSDPGEDRRRSEGAEPMDSEARAALHQALEEFARIDPRACTVITLLHFWEFAPREVAESLKVTERTVFRDARAARAWLARRVAQILDGDVGNPAREPGSQTGDMPHLA